MGTLPTPHEPKLDPRQIPADRWAGLLSRQATPEYLLAWGVTPARPLSLLASKEAVGPPSSKLADTSATLENYTINDRQECLDTLSDYFAPAGWLELMLTLPGPDPVGIVS